MAATRVMGVYPENIDYLQMMLPYQGTINSSRIQQLGESIESVQQDFYVLPHMDEIKQPPPFWRRALISGWG